MGKSYCKINFGNVGGDGFKTLSFSANFRMIMSHSLKEACGHLSNCALNCDKSSIPAVVRSSPNLYVSWEEHVFRLCSSIFNVKKSFDGLKEKIELTNSICDESLALNSSENLSVAEKLIILYRKNSPKRANLSQN